MWTFFVSEWGLFGENLQPGEQLGLFSRVMAGMNNRNKNIIRQLLYCRTDGQAERGITGAIGADPVSLCPD